MEQKQDCDCGYDHVHVAEATADGTKMPFSQAMTEMLRKLSEYGVEMGDKAGEVVKSLSDKPQTGLPPSELARAKHMADRVLAKNVSPPDMKQFCEYVATEIKRLEDPDQVGDFEGWKGQVGDPCPFSDAWRKHRKTLCGGCGAREGKEGGILLQCAKCKGQMYCSKECQKKHWAMHKRACKAA